jgi:thiamine-phosphate pyrophosphorylase
VVARLCRRRGLVMVVAGDARLAVAVGAGIHLRCGYWPGQVRLRRRLVSSSAHNGVELRRASLSGAHIAFLSPAFATRSHPEVPALGPVRWLRVARTANIPIAALGGIDHITAVRLPARFCHGVGAIGALAPG